MNDDDDLLFGAYAPSVGGNNNNRPTTAPDRRSVHFADDLGLDLNDDSADGRPSTAPEKKKTSASADFLLDSSLDESTGKDFFSKVKQKKNSQQQNTETGGAEAKKETKKGSYNNTPLFLNKITIHILNENSRRDRRSFWEKIRRKSLFGQIFKIKKFSDKDSVTLNQIRKCVLYM